MPAFRRWGWRRSAAPPAVDGAGGGPVLDQENDDDYLPPRAPLWRRILVPALAVSLLVIAGVLLRNVLRHGPSPRPHTEQHIVSIKLPPPPPPPPPPKTPPPPTKTTQQHRTNVPAKVPRAPPKPQSAPAAASTSIKGNGPGALAEGNGGGGDCIGEGCGTGEGGGEDDAYYRNLVDSAIKDALERDERVAHSRFSGIAVLIFDRSGHVVSARLNNFDGDPEVRTAVQGVLQRLALGGELPQEMAGNPFSIRVAARSVRG